MLSSASSAAGAAMGMGGGGYAHQPPPQRTVFTAAQWAELEQQALIYKYLMAGVPVPPDLLLPVRPGPAAAFSFAGPAAASPFYHQHHPELLRLLRQETGPGAVAVPPHRRQEVAVLQGGAPRLQVLRAPHAPWPQPFKKACGIQDRLVVVARAPVAAPAVHRHHHRASRAPCSGGGQGPRPVPRRRRCWLVAPRRRCFECSLSLW
uniref:Growth-regulating factor n=1 Tax=Zea mays TaxID=4577 RepID=A0A804PUK6_MAIZE